MIKVEEVSKGYDKIMVDHKIDMQVKRGEIHGLIGANGSGKTTLMKCLAGIYRPDKGRVTYDGEIIYDSPKVKQRVAYVSDSQDFLSVYSVSGMLKLYQAFYENFSMEKFDELNKRFLLNRKKGVAHLSKGQKTKLAFMLAIAQGADYLIMDEPESGLDAESRMMFREILIDEVEKRQLGVVISSHNLSGIERLCDSLTVLDRGKVIRQGNLNELMEGVQKWQGVWNDPNVPEKLTEPKIIVCSKIGKLTEFYTIGDRKRNLELLQKSGIEEAEGKQITLEEVYYLIRQGKGGAGYEGL